jgi:hypothetical protein
MTVLAVIEILALYLLYSWLIAAIVASDLSDRKGYGEKIGLAFGLLGSVVGAVIWLFVPPKAGSPWSRRVRRPDLITAAAAVVLFLSLVLPWYSNGSNFFEEIRWYELLLPLAAVIAYSQVHIRAGGRGSDSLRFVTIGAAVLALVMVGVAIATKPDGADLEWGAYLSLAAAVVAVAGAVWAAMVDRSTAGEAATVAQARASGAETA